ncbi:aminopeptidase P family protein [Candidatus Galacturonibacter soehngenii]|uniref:Aminopeptidase P family protein n=1 Tax=Candidatus Galacturonatibacter soehngenii TaxID=2307010 RepID=A0A7V7UH08_9FIRM|nr:aminopeptidase P family protein [Candidatus Galacturonibacter soehngenii]KAB1439513.1 aminopeptidase P family protein [Candidatus Galacturonibacter soehngenii]MBA4687027.1 aminopeptidase P family protein [Candidatus Galacturonibacter soehngenii]
MTMKERIEALRVMMNNNNIDIYLVPTADFHQSEYVGEYFKCRNYLSGFTGSAGTLVVTSKEAGLWTDGRYFIQAEGELKESIIDLYRMGEENVPTVSEFIQEHLKEGQTLGFDGRVVSFERGEELEKIVKEKKANLVFEQDLVHLIWEDRPQLSKEKAFLIEEKFSGMSTKKKLELVRSALEKENADLHVLTSLDDIAWLFNIRGNDVEHNPVVLSYAVITPTKAFLFLNETVLNDEIRKDFKENGITVLPYNDIYSYVKETDSQKTVLLDKAKVNYTIGKSLSTKIIHELNPTTALKAIKNAVEIENTRNAHIKDGVAFTKFMYWLKQNVGKIEITELSATDYLYQQRSAQENFIELSFETICAYKENAAMMHYAATKEHNATIKPEGLLLVDSGGQYFEGTTDITRTMALGEVDTEQKKHFTAVVVGMLQLMNAKFLYGCRGINLDVLARAPIWELDIDYKCGTGHGVGHILNVHEGPNGFRPKLLKDNEMNCILEEGMITTDEPGIYIEGSHGIRIENELLCKKGIKNEHGQFMYFENLTFAPIDLDAIVPELMSVKEKNMLNNYHKQVFEKLSPFMNEEETKWLKEYTREI